MSEPQNVSATSKAGDLAWLLTMDEDADREWVLGMTELEQKHSTGIISVGGLVCTINKMMAAEQAGTFERDFPLVQDPRQEQSGALASSSIF